MKLFRYIFIWVLLIWITSMSYAQDPIIIPRASWWANSLYNAIQSDYWKKILTARQNAYSNLPSTSPTIAQIAAQEKTQKINDYLSENFSNQFNIDEKISISPSTWEELAWKISYADIVDWIIIHHTDSEYENTVEWLRDIHRYHSLNRQWWDIWYNYIIWYDGKIYEWREGWDYVIWAHSKYNNNGTLWIAIMWNYSVQWINTEQYKTLDNLVKYLTQKYGIDLSKKRYYHTDCAFAACDIFPLETYLEESLVWHRDTWHTSCPWDKLYNQIQKIRTSNLEFTKWLTPVIRWELQNKNIISTFQTSQIQKILSLLEKYSNEQIQIINNEIEKRLKTDIDQNTKKILQIIKIAGVIRLK